MTWEGGILGSLGGMVVGGLGVFAASRRYHVFRQFSLPFKAFLITSSTSFAGESSDRLLESNLMRNVLRLTANRSTLQVLLLQIVHREDSRRVGMPIATL